MLAESHSFKVNDIVIWFYVPLSLSHTLSTDEGKLRPYALNGLYKAGSDRNLGCKLQH